MIPTVAEQMRARLKTYDELVSYRLQLVELLDVITAKRSGNSPIKITIGAGYQKLTTTNVPVSKNVSVELMMGFPLDTELSTIIAREINNINQLILSL